MFNQKQMLSQLKKMQEQVLKAQQDLKEEKVEGAAGGGKVTVRFNGHMEVESVRLDPSLLNPEDSEMLEDLIALAFRDGSQKVKELTAQKMAPFTGGMPIPGF